jgi:ribose transport system permease protein
MALAVTTAPAPAFRPRLSKALLSIPELGVSAAVVVFFAVFVVIDPHMGTLENLRLMSLQGSMVGLAAFGMSFLLIAGEIDLSAGATAGLAAVIAGLLRFYLGWPELACYGCAVALGAVVGLINSVVVLRIGMPSFFATLGASFLIAGLTNWLVQGSWISTLDKTPLLVSVLQPSPVFGLPWLFVLLLLPAYIIGDLLIRLTVVGPLLTAVGGNRQAAEIAGINVPLVKTLCFMFVGICAALAGLAVAGYAGTIDATIGIDWMLWIIAIAIIGGGSLRGGVGSVIGALLGTVLVEIIRTGLFDANVKTNAQSIVVGAILIGAAVLDAFRRKSAQY